MTLPGASELAIILGLQRGTDDGEPYVSEYTLWARLVGLVPRYDSNRSPDAELGVMFEWAIAADWMRRHTVLAWAPGPKLDEQPLARPGIPWTARPDFTVAVPMIRPLEVKCPRSLHPDEWGPDKSDEVPPYYAVQVLAQMAVLDADGGYLAAVARAPGWGSNRIRGDFMFDRNMERERLVVERVSEWVDRHIVNLHPPEVDGSRSTDTTLRLAGRALDSRVAKAATAQDTEMVRRALQTATAVEELRGRQREARNKIMASMGDATELVADGETIATFRPNKHGVRSLRIRNDQGADDE